MNALLIRDEWLGAFSVRLHEELLAVTLAAGGWDRSVGNRRLGVVGTDNLMRLSVAVLAGGSGNAGLGGLGMEAVREGLLCVAVAVGAADLFGWGFVGQALDVFVAVDAQEHAAVDRMRELVAIDEERDLLAILFFGQGRVGMAGKAVFVLELVFGAERGDRDKKREGQQVRKNSSGRRHTLGESYFETLRRDSGHKQAPYGSHWSR